MLGGVLLKRDASSLAFTAEAEATSIWGALGFSDGDDNRVLITTLGDVDGDGDIDVLAAGGDLLTDEYGELINEQTFARLFLNDGSGSFTEAPTSLFDAATLNIIPGLFTAGITAHHAMEFLDMDAD